MNNWTAWVGVKFGTLTVEKYLGYQNRGSAYFLVRCDCGKTKKVTIWEFKKGKEKSCGLLRCKAKVKGLTGTPKPPETITQQDETASALETRLKPKYYCRAVTPLKPKVRKEVKPLTDNGYIHYLRLFAKKWVRKRELTDECNIK